MWRGCALIGWSGGRFCSWSSKNTIFPLLPPSKPYYYFSPTGGEKRGKETDKSSLGLKEKQKDWKHFIIQWHFHIMSKLRLWIIRDMLRLCAAVRSSTAGEGRMWSEIKEDSLIRRQLLLITLSISTSKSMIYLAKDQETKCWGYQDSCFIQKARRHLERMWRTDLWRGGREK